MNTVQKIACRIESRIDALISDGVLPKAGKRTDTALESWIGATMGLAAVLGDDHADTQHMLKVATMVICVRGYSEMKAIARKAREDERFAQVEAEARATQRQL